MTTATHLKLVQPLASEWPTRPADSRVRHFGRWSLMNRSHVDYVMKIWWQVGYQAGVDAAKGEQR